MMIVLGSILALRSWRRGALHQATAPATADEREQRRRIWIVIALCIAYAWCWSVTACRSGWRRQFT